LIAPPGGPGARAPTSAAELEVDLGAHPDRAATGCRTGASRLPPTPGIPLASLGQCRRFARPGSLRSPGMGRYGGWKSSQRPEMPKAASGLETLAALRISSSNGDEIRGPLGSTLLLLARIERQRGGGHAANAAEVGRASRPRIRGRDCCAEAGPASFLRETDRSRARMRCGGRQVFAKGGEHGGTFVSCLSQTLTMRAPFKL